MCKAQERRATYFEAQKLRKGRSGSRILSHEANADSFLFSAHLLSWLLSLEGYLLITIIRTKIEHNYGLSVADKRPIIFRSPKHHCHTTNTP